MTAVAASGHILADVMSHILGFLLPEDVARVARVAKFLNGPAVLRYWEALDLTKIFYKRGQIANILDQEVWETCIINRLKACKSHIDEILFNKLVIALEIEGSDAAPATEEGRRTYIARALDAVDSALHAKVLKALGLSFDEGTLPSKKNQFMAFRRLLAFPIEENRGGTLVTLPKGLSFNILHSLFPDKLKYIPIFTAQIVAAYGHAEVDRMRVVIMTNDVFSRSRNQCFSEQCELVHGKGYELPNMLVVISLALLTEAKLGERRFGDKPSTNTVCIENSEGYPVFVGGFALSGLNVYSGYHRAIDHIGVAGAEEVL